MVKIAPSILAADLTCLQQEVEKILSGGADWLHFDVMDNHYVPGITFGPALCGQLHRKFPQLVLDVHLMARPVEYLIEQFAEMGASYLTFHPEVSDHLDRTLKLIHTYGCKTGLAFNPGSDLSPLTYVKQQVDMVLLMSVNPGAGGQPFIPIVYDKLADLKERGFLGVVSIDGGVNENNAKDLIQAGGEVLVVGSALFKSKDYAATIRRLKDVS